jgi:enoyl-CoA hydratase/carnithine racemase
MRVSGPKSSPHPILADRALPASLDVAIDGDIAIIHLNRPERRNAIDDATVHGLEWAFQSLPPEVKAVVLAGRGEHFSAGLDLSEVTDTDVAGGIAHSRGWHRAFEAIEYGRVPVVSVMHGAVVGGGLELVCSTQIRVAEKSTFYALPEGMRGIFVGGGGSVRISRLIGVSRMQDMMLTGRTYGAEEGQAIGLSHYVVEPGEGLAKGMDLARRIAKNTQMTNFAVQHILPRIGAIDPVTGLVLETLISSIAQGDPEAKERLKDFLEKRAAKVSHTS